MSIAGVEAKSAETLGAVAVGALKLRIFGPRHSGQLRLFCFAVANVYDVNCPAWRGFTQKIHNRAVVFDSHAIKSGDYVATNQARLVRGRFGRFDIAKCDATVRVCETIDAE